MLVFFDVLSLDSSCRKAMGCLPCLSPQEGYGKLTKNANAWVRNTIPAKRRRLFELLELREPPCVFRVGSM